ncbi:acetylornithine transaminase [Galbitalea sp. SE-J8]|uniref:acetylornithine transaminase n=1 Tax=Galbitalea sp. SE-J8 TaxID=3054952 RepID=UPI00259C7C86|nr:acetylornithine transaminase [Galbitalea sp. SE-J8]MDM4762524.1 acetylornithine transaminase [Galbitalea sp. SE-J8]
MNAESRWLRSDEGASRNPAPESESWRDRFAASLMKSTPAPLTQLDHGLGAEVWDVDGKRYLDFLGGIAVNALGHAHPVFVGAVATQAAKLAHISNYFASAPQVELAERLKRVTGAGDAGRVYFCNSGAEAMEAAFKLARRNRQHGTIVALHQAFHGRTMGALALTGKPALQGPFEPMVPGVVHIDSTIAALERAITGQTAALVLEPIKGEAGVLPLPAGFLERARELTAQHGALLIVDEIQTGMGRTGTWFEYQQHGILPDAVAVAKGIAGGFPLGALVTFGAASDLFTAGQHGSTYAGNPLATAVGNAVMGEIERADLPANAARRGAELRAAIEGIGSPLVEGTRGAGLLVGVALTAPVAQRVATAALARGLIVNAANDSTIRLAPPLTIGDAEIAEFTALFSAALKDAA